jgi:hypothetical protein
MNTVLTVLVIAALALLAGAYFLWRRGAPTRQVVLMAVLAATMLANVVIWTLPYSSGEAPVDKADAFEK